MTSYSEFKLEQLKAELRKCNVKVNGKKLELIGRLQFLDSVGRGVIEPEPGKVSNYPFYVHRILLYSMVISYMISSGVK
jgi:hypothetical protein